MLGWVFNFFDKLFPQYCIGCKKFGNILCTSCLNAIPIEAHAEVKRIGSPVYSAFLYRQNSLFAKAIQSAKYYHCSSILKDLIEKAIITIPEEWKKQNIILIPVPLHFWRRQLRGYNQSEIIAKELLLHFPHWKISPLIKRIKNNKQQAKLGKQERKNNVKDIFEVSQKDINKIPFNTPIVFIDDIISSGATLYEMKRCLEKTEYKLSGAWCLGSAKE